jgi:hypothetical protein
MGITFSNISRVNKTGDSLSALAKLMQQIVLIIVANKFSNTDINLGISMSTTSEEVIY